MRLVTRQIRSKRDRVRANRPRSLPGNTEEGIRSSSAYYSHLVASYPEFSPPGREFTHALGLSVEQTNLLINRARKLQTSFSDEAVASGLVQEKRYFEQLARHLGLPFMEHVDPDRLLVTDRSSALPLGTSGSQRISHYRELDGRSLIVVAPRSVDLDRLNSHFLRFPEIRSRVRISTPTALRNAVIVANEDRLLERAINNLDTNSPAMSAKTVANAWQGVVLGAALIGIPLLATQFPVATALIAHAFFSFFFLSCIYLRLAAASRSPVQSSNGPTVTKNTVFPVYSVLVPLYREAHMVPGLLAALATLRWPRSRLEIKIICEADDQETLAMLKKQKPRSWVEIVEVPPASPRTKPKALNFAAQLCSGEFVTIYDAEDRPHPLQLVEAWQRFRGSGPELACLQAPLVTANFRSSIWAKMFAFEYAALFRGILPWLAAGSHVLPLGGTSNHFRGLMYQLHQAVTTRTSLIFIPFRSCTRLEQTLMNTRYPACYQKGLTC